MRQEYCRSHDQEKENEGRSVPVHSRSVLIEIVECNALIMHRAINWYL